MLADRISEDCKTAMKAREADRVSVLRMTLSEIKNARIEKGEDLTDGDVVQVLKRAVKQRQEAVEQYRAGGRPELADKEEKEIEVLSAYLPEMLGPDDLERAVKEAVAATGASSMKDMGKVMKAVMAEHGARVDGKTVQQAVRAALGG